VLEHLLEYPAYKAFYQARRIAGDFLILDNSAHERHEGQAPEELLASASDIRPQEIVCPDALFDTRRTLQLTYEALTYFLNQGKALFRALRPRIMFVAQGQCKTDWVRCFEHQLRYWEAMGKDLQSLGCPGLTFGISKDYETFSGEIIGLLEDYVLPAKLRFSQAEIHLLGWGRKLHALQEIDARYGDHIRSVDSAKPFVYAKAGISLSMNGDIPPYPKRDSNYFTDSIIDRDLIKHNIRIFKLHAGDTYGL
jgi:hypothetical protein